MARNTNASTQFSGLRGSSGRGASGVVVRLTAAQSTSARMANAHAVHSSASAEQRRQSAPRPRASLSPRCTASAPKASLRGQPCGRRFKPRHHACTAAVARIRSTVGVTGAPGLSRCFRACLSAQVPARIRAYADARLPPEPHKMASRRHELAVIEPFNVLA
jgi:hypothetical protein